VVFKVMAEGTVEIITGRERRRRWRVEDKLKIVEQTLEPGASVNQVAARHDVYPGRLFTWRRQMRSGKLAAQRKALFFPVQTHDTALPALPAQMERTNSAPRQIEIELKNGSRVRVEEGVSLTALRRVLAALRE
jgi:transposase